MVNGASSSPDQQLINFVSWVRSAADAQGQESVTIPDSEALSAILGTADFAELAMLVTLAEEAGWIVITTDGISLGPRALEHDGAGPARTINEVL